MSRLLEAFGSDATIRVMGSAIAVEMDDEEEVQQPQTRCRRAGLLVDADEDTLLNAPHR